MKKSLELVFKEDANIEFMEAFLYYEEQLEGLGERFLKELEKVILSINLSPKGFQLFNKKNGTRQIPMNIFPFVIIYKVIEKQLIILAVFKTPQDPKKKIR
jgi:hypothetical protein